MLYEVITCGNDITPTVSAPAAAASYSHTVRAAPPTDCANNTADWTYTYTVDMPAFTLRITSYNVCYTKLLRRWRANHWGQWIIAGIQYRWWCWLNCIGRTFDCARLVGWNSEGWHINRVRVCPVGRVVRTVGIGKGPDHVAFTGYWRWRANHWGQWIIAGIQYRWWCWLNCIA